MNAPLFSSPPQGDYQAEAVKLVAWLHRMSEFFSRHAPALREDIENFADAAALLDSFRAGLVPVTYHPAMRMETVRWVDPAVTMPAPDVSILMIVEGIREVVSGWSVSIDKRTCFHGDAYALNGARVLFWAYLPAGPILDGPAEVQP